MSDYPLFELGQVVATKSVIELGIPMDVIASLLTRHVTGDWGQIDDEDRLANDAAVQPENQARIMSVYTMEHAGEPMVLWIITEHDRSVTTVLRPEDY
jgi:hypothetical protein